jgi:HEAT repeat protein
MPLFGEPDVASLEAKRDVKRLIKALGYKKNLTIGEAAAAALVRIGAPAVEPLSAALKDKRWPVRELAAQALGQIGDARAVEPLSAALKDRYSSVLESAAKALGQIGAPPVEPLSAALNATGDTGDVCFLAAEALSQIVAPPVEPLVAVLKGCTGHDSWLAGWVARALGKIGDARAVEPLIPALKDEEEYPRKTAAEALGRIGGAGAVEVLNAALKDGDKDVRKTAVEALGRIGDARAVLPLVTAIEDEEESSGVQPAAARALGILKDRGELDGLIPRLKEQERICRELGDWAGLATSLVLRS